MGDADQIHPAPEAPREAREPVARAPVAWAPVARAVAALDREASGQARRLVVTGGPTREAIDAVRFLSNRSTGRMGIEIARAAAEAGWAVLLILGPTHLEPPRPKADAGGALETVRVVSAVEMQAAVLAALPWCGALVMSAAVADYAPADPVAGKIKKGEGELVLRLRRTPDILASVAAAPARAGKRIVGFALEPELNLAEGRRKLIAKDLDAIVVNTTDAFGAGASAVTILRRDGEDLPLGVLDKSALAERLLDTLLL